ncbi:MAG: hypothetical protein DRQ58_12455, partial [Gammaproteobacteria bacterium]
TAITMWSESLIEGLYIGIAKSGNDNALKGLIKELREKGYENNYLINKVNSNVGPTEARRLRALMGLGGTPSTASKAKAKAKTKKKGFFSKMFGK